VLQNITDLLAAMREYENRCRQSKVFALLTKSTILSLKQQKLSTIKEKINVIDTNLVLVGWTGNILAHSKNGNTMIMNNYSVTNVFKKINGKWRLIHSLESSLPTEMEKSKKLIFLISIFLHSSS